MNDKLNFYQIGKAKIYTSVYIDNPIVCGSPEGLSEIFMEFEKLKIKNKKLHKFIDDLINNGMDNELACRLEELEQEEM